MAIFMAQQNWMAYYRLGTAFKLTTNGTLTTLVSFSGANGSIPLSALTQGNDGNFYGATEYGGSFFSGNIFKLTPGGTLTGVYSFTGGNDGSSPVSALVQGNDGNFYGTMTDGGTYGAGNVSKLAPNGAFTNLYSFTGGIDGSAPVNPLVQASDSNSTARPAVAAMARAIYSSYRPTAPSLISTPSPAAWMAVFPWVHWCRERTVISTARQKIAP